MILSVTLLPVRVILCSTLDVIQLQISSNGLSWFLNFSLAFKALRNDEETGLLIYILEKHNIFYLIVHVN